MVVVDKENFMGGTGIAHFEHIMSAQEMHGMNRVYAKVTLKKVISFFLEWQHWMIIMRELYI